MTNIDILRNLTKSIDPESSDDNPHIVDAILELADRIEKLEAVTRVDEHAGTASPVCTSRFRYVEIVSPHQSPTAYGCYDDPSLCGEESLVIDLWKINEDAVAQWPTTTNKENG